MLSGLERVGCVDIVGWAGRPTDPKTGNRDEDAGESDAGLGRVTNIIQYPW